ncbi:RluA family pseudouridine synthase [Leadbettera azotonutricia]|uniref:Ribosomal large subunit pseudouridine synthase C n=1 Tax=Leadbettera azotonutricia (strain ATCC BAA-888 / DSM 13862 / ZAS-9) TaxID=545695 RepID=F5Y9I9_LEAAZ|nr:RluA family pseudouridine synthase [Leadbettera azotonutricia]AEF81154.1 ribosomal large subunit pseudouridine synthase C [Leadbettera azotonutricia ZAS-9]
MKDLSILFENKDCLVINKPAGLAVQGGEGIKTSLDSLLAENYDPRPLLVHRLDRDTSGVILVAKNKEAAARFSSYFAERSQGSQIRKLYLGICSKTPQPSSGVIRLPLEIKGKTKESETRYRLVSENPGIPCSLLELELGSGRMHQIRRHLAQINCPILGDDKYGDFGLNKTLHKSIGLKRLLLHASRLIIPEEGIDITAPLPEYFAPFSLTLAGVFSHDT